MTSLRRARSRIESSLSASAIIVRATICSRQPNVGHHRTDSTRSILCCTVDSQHVHGIPFCVVPFKCCQSAFESLHACSNRCASCSTGEVSLRKHSDDLQLEVSLVLAISLAYAVSVDTAMNAYASEHDPAAAHTCEVYAFVEATPISQPALMCTPQCVDRAMAEPTVLVTPMQSAPRAFAYSSACMHILLQEL